MRLELVGKILASAALLVGLLIIGLAAAVEYRWVSIGIEASSIAVVGVFVSVVPLSVALALERAGR